MRKLEMFFDTKSETYFTNRSKLENFYSAAITSSSHGRQTPLEKIVLLINLKKANPVTRINSLELKFCDFLTRWLDRIITLNPIELHYLTARMNRLGLTELFYKMNPATLKNSKTNFCKEILEALKYDSDLGSGKIGKDLARMLNIKACLYCNAQYSFSYKAHRGRISKLQLDHFYSKSRYPYISISLYNLVPSCSYCNQKKSGTNFNIDKFVHPHLDSLESKFEFSLSSNSESKIVGKYPILEKNIEVIVESLDLKFKNHDKVFDLTGIYSNFNKEVKNIYNFAMAYPHINRKKLLDIKSKSGQHLFESEEDIISSFLGTGLETKNINEAPLSKLRQDFWKKALKLSSNKGN